jgi:hypothetical protein
LEEAASFETRYTRTGLAPADDVDPCTPAESARLEATAIA